MKKKLAALLVIAMITGTFMGCGKTEEAPAEAPGQGTEEEAPAEAPAEEAALDTASLGELFMFVDGADVTDGNTTYDSISDKFAEASDGFVRYYTSPADVSVVIGTSEGATAWGTIVPGQDPIYGIENIYMVTTAADFSVSERENRKGSGNWNLLDLLSAQ